ncbi:MAG: DNA damage-inducible protein D, partial [Patescibacteria group bacterium]
YRQWRDFQKVIKRAQDSCITANHNTNDHFVQARKMIKIATGSHGETNREIEDMELTRYACYLTAQNGDPKIKEIAFAQMYFAAQTRKQELLEQGAEELERLIARHKLKKTESEFAKTLWEHDVDGCGIREIRAAGDRELFGGLNTKKMKSRLKIKDKRKPLADYLPSVTLKAKDLAAEVTTINTKRRDLHGKESIKREHKNNNRGMRSFLSDRNIIPENLPMQEDIKIIAKKHKKIFEIPE